MERLLEDAEAIKAKEGEVVDYSIDSFADIVEAIHVIQEENGITGTTVAEGATTIEGAINRVKAAWENWLVAAANGNEDITEQTETLVDTVSKAAALIIPRVANILSTLMEEVGKKAPEIWGKFKEAVDNSLSEEDKQKFKDFGDSVKTICDAVTTLAEAIKAVTNLIAWAGREVNGFIETAKGVGEFLDGFPSLIEAAFTGNLDSLNDNGRKIVEGFVSGAEYEWDFSGKGFFENIGGWIKTHKGPIEYDRRLLVENGAAIIEGLIAGSSNKWGSENHLFTDIVKSIAGYFGNSDNMLVGSGSGMMAGLYDGIGSTWQNVGKFVAEIPGAMTGMFDGSMGWLVGSGQGFVGGLMDGISRMFGDLVNLIQSIPNAIIGMFSNAGEWLVNAGKSIIIGFWNGLMDAWNGVADWIGGIGQWIVDNKGPEQYDKRLLVPAGKWIMGGLRGGLEQAFEHEVQPYVESMASAIEDSFGNPQLSPYAATMTHNTSTMATQPQQVQPTNVTAILELDRVQFGKLVFQLNGDETQRIGVDLVGGYA